MMIPQSQGQGLAGAAAAAHAMGHSTVARHRGNSYEATSSDSKETKWSVANGVV